MEEKVIFLKQNQEYITLSNLLKITGIISTGGQAKVFLQNADIKVNGISENRRGRKLKNNDLIFANGQLFKIKNYGD